ncbi:MAG: SGNH/GDSL hydrolase family protein [Melioribacteraceae bacterium]|nr:SGNH/GDSL hydrolase family protein [Melioribacteraceae bacterium]
MKSIFKIILFNIILIIFFGCADRSELTENQSPLNNQVSFERFVVLGNSLTAGYQSGSLYKSAQDYSFGKQIANIVKANFEQPYASDPGLGSRIEISSLSPFTLKVNSNQGVPTNLNYSAPYNNLAVPGAFTYDILNATKTSDSYSAKGGKPNPLFDVVLRGLGSPFKQAKTLKPTLVFCWIGNNDILGHATNGGTIPYTDPTQFASMWKQLADSLASLKTKVVIANIPSVTAIPFFTTVPPVTKNPATGQIIPLYGQTKTGIRQLILGQDLVTLQATSVLTDASGNATGIGLSSSRPLPDAVVLDKDEIATIQNVISSYNSTLASLANSNGFAIVDFNTFFNNIAKNGITADGIKFTTEFVNGGLFSLDGVHPTSQGYSIVANEFIKVINQKWGSNIPLINVSTVPGSLILSKKIQQSQLGTPIIPKGALDNLLF